MMKTMLQSTTYMWRWGWVGRGARQQMGPCGEVAVTDAEPLHWVSVKDWKIEEAM